MTLSSGVSRGDVTTGSKQLSRLLEPAPGGPAERFAAAVGYGTRYGYFAAAVGGSILLVGLMVALRLLLTRLLLHIGGLASWDQHLSAWLARNRHPSSSTLVGRVDVRGAAS